MCGEVGLRNVQDARAGALGRWPLVMTSHAVDGSRTGCVAWI